MGSTHGDQRQKKSVFLGYFSLRLLSRLQPLVSFKASFP
jgi:hypothetical protein